MPEPVQVHVPPVAPQVVTQPAPVFIPEPIQVQAPPVVVTAQPTPVVMPEPVQVHVPPVAPQVVAQPAPVFIPEPVQAQAPPVAPQPHVATTAENVAPKRQSALMQKILKR